MDDNGDAEIICVVERLHLSMSGDSEHSGEVGWLARRTDERVVLDDADVSIRRSAMVVLCMYVMMMCGPKAGENDDGSTMVNPARAGQFRMENTRADVSISFFIFLLDHDENNVLLHDTAGLMPSYCKLSMGHRCS